MDTGIAIVIGLIVGACIGGGMIYAALEKIAKAIEKQKWNPSDKTRFEYTFTGKKYTSSHVNQYRIIQLTTYGYIDNIIIIKYVPRVIKPHFFSNLKLYPISPQDPI